MTNEHEDTPQDMQDKSIMMQSDDETSFNMESPLEKRKSEYQEKNTSMKMKMQQDPQLEDRDHVFMGEEEEEEEQYDDELAQQQMQREREEMLYSLYESHNIPSPLPPNVMPGRKMVHLIGQATKSKSSMTLGQQQQHRRSKYAKSMPDLHLTSSVSRFIEGWNPLHGGEGSTKTRSKSYSNVEGVIHDTDDDDNHFDSLTLSNTLKNNNNNKNESSTLLERTPSSSSSTKHPTAVTSSLAHAIHVSPSFHIKQQQRATWMPGVTYLPLLVIQYVCHPFYVIWKNLSTDSNTLLPKLSTTNSPMKDDDDTTMEYVFMMGGQDEEKEEIHHPFEYHAGQHHHRHHHHHKHHRHHSKEEMKVHKQEDENDNLQRQEGANAWKYLPLSFTQNTSTSTPSSYIPGGDLFVE